MSYLTRKKFLLTVGGLAAKLILEVQVTPAPQGTPFAFCSPGAAVLKNFSKTGSLCKWEYDIVGSTTLEFASCLPPLHLVNGDEVEIVEVV